MLDLTRVLSRGEILTCLSWLKHKRRRGPNVLVNLAIFRLSACCGLRRCELTGLNIGDVIVSGSRPVVKVRKEVTKGRRNVSPSNPKGKDMRKARTVPLWWDAGTLADLTAHKALRLQQTGGDQSAPFVASPSGLRLSVRCASARWRSVMKSALGAERAGQLSIHCGRHSFPSHASVAGRSLAEVMSAMGHENPATTALYLHAFDSETAVDAFA